LGNAIHARHKLRKILGEADIRLHRLQNDRGDEACGHEKFLSMFGETDDTASAHFAVRIS
jgi:hypothetical protein